MKKNIIIISLIAIVLIGTLYAKIGNKPTNFLLGGCTTVSPNPTPYCSESSAREKGDFMTLFKLFNSDHIMIKGYYSNKALKDALKMRWDMKKDEHKLHIKLTAKYVIIDENTVEVESKAVGNKCTNIERYTMRENNLYVLTIGQKGVCDKTQKLIYERKENRGEDLVHFYPLEKSDKVSISNERDKLIALYIGQISAKIMDNWKYKDAKDDWSCDAAYLTRCRG